jgi:putative DNA primase/helicase
MNATALAEAIGGKRQRKSNGGWVVCCLAHPDRSPSLSIDDGDDGRVLLRCFAGCDQQRIIDALRSRGLWGGGASADFRPPTDDERKAREAERERDRRRRIGEALAKWAASQLAAGTLVEAYMISRGLTLSVPPTLRYHPHLLYAQSGIHLPAMVAAVQAPDRSIVGIHRTYLRQDGRGKAGVEKPKMALGPIGGGAVRLGAAGPTLIVGEGIESCLSVAQETGLPSWAGLGTAGLAEMILPPLPEAAEVIIAADHDRNGAGQEAANRAAERWLTEGRRVRIAVPPHPDTDFNDVLRADELAAGAILS